VNLNIRGNDLHIDDDLRTFASERVARLDHLASDVVDAKLELRHHTRKNSPHGFVVAQLTIQSGKQILRAEERHDDAKKAIDLAADRMASQIRKAHERKSSRDRRKALDTLPVDTGSAPFIEEAGTVIRTKHHAVKPMDVEEAVEQMELLGHTFFVFQNADGGKIEVLYRRNDGAYGRIIPDLA
jgi:putative sigma-54 modulation protein